MPHLKAWQKVSVAVLLLFSIPAALFFFMTIHPGESVVRRIAVSRLKGALGSEVSIGSLETNLISRLRLNNARIFHVEKGDTVTFLNIDELLVSYTMRSLFKRKLLIEDVKLDGVNLFVHRDSTGRDNLPEAIKVDRKKNGASTHVFEVDLGELNILDGRIRYRDETQNGFNTLASNISITAKRRDGKNYNINLRCHDGAIERGGISIPFNRLFLDGNAGAGKARLDSLSVEFAGADISGSGAIEIDDGVTAVAADLHLAADLGNISPLLVGFLPEKYRSMKGDLFVTARVDGSLPMPRIRCSLDISDLETAGMKVPDIKVEARVCADSLCLDNMEMEIFGGNASCKGSIRTDSLSSAGIDLLFTGLDLHQIALVIYSDPLPYGGKVGGALSATGLPGDPGSWHSSVSLSLSHLSYRSIPQDDIRVKGTIGKGKAELELKQDGADLSAKLELLDEKVSGRFIADVKRIEPIVALFNISDLSGEFKMHGLIEGRFKSPDISADIAARNLLFRNFPIDTLSGSIFYGEKGLRVSQLYFSGISSEIDTLSPPFGILSLSGGLSYSGHLRDYPDNTTGETSVQLYHPGFNNVRLDSLMLIASMTGREIDVSSMVLRRDGLEGWGNCKYFIEDRKGLCDIGLTIEDTPDSSGALLGADGAEDAGRISGTLNASFEIQEKGRYSVSAVGDQIDLEIIDILLGERDRIAGDLGFELEASGNLFEPEASLKLKLLHPRFRDVTVDSLYGTIKLDRDQLELRDFELRQSIHRASIRATAGLLPTESGRPSLLHGSPFKGVFIVDDIDLSLLMMAVMPSISAQGRCAVDIGWDGTLGSPRPHGKIAVSQGSLRLRNDNPEIDSLSLDASIVDSTFTINDLSGRVMEVPFRLLGSAVYAGKHDMATKLSLSLSDHGTAEGHGVINSDSIQMKMDISNIDLSLIRPFIPLFDRLSGNLHAALSIGGQTSYPVINGRISCRELTVKPVWLEETLTKGQIYLSFRQNTVFIDTFSIWLNGGEIYATGEISHEKGVPVSLDLKSGIRDLGIDRPRSIKAKIKTADLTLRTEAGYHKLEGDIILGETQFLANFKPKSILPFARSIERPDREFPDFIDKTRFNIRVRGSDQIWIDNNLARLRMSAEVGLIGNIERPLINGRVSVARGYLLFLDRKLTISRGILDFSDPDRLNPVIDLVAGTTIKSYRAMEVTTYDVTLSVSGTLDETKVELTSDPPLDRTDIVSLLTLGVTRTQLTDPGVGNEPTTLKGVLLERAQELSSKRMTGYISRNIGGMLGLDQVTIDGNLFRFDNSWGPELLASKKLTGKAEVTYRTNIGHLNEQSIRLDYHFTGRLSLQGETDQLGRSGLDFKYRLHFK
ncbi:MAG: translocation/assembly module TamB domain-containing protein [Candidatus Krumholzibacteriota bacterium]|nr:translocation/assembly module TamB domain-containing protein [Candidatus Krumholzibacteriota bacterium]